jgi:hypothetical protein
VSASKRPRRSTVAAAVVFVAAAASYVAFRPDPSPHRRTPADPTTVAATTTVAPTAAPGR